MSISLLNKGTATTRHTSSGLLHILGGKDRIVDVDVQQCNCIVMHAINVLSTLPNKNTHNVCYTRYTLKATAIVL